MADAQVLILGATSDIAKEAAKIWAEQGCQLYLVARNEERLSRVADWVSSSGSTSPVTWCTDLAVTANDETREWFETLPHIDIVLIAYGVMPLEHDSSLNSAIAENVDTTNHSSTIGWVDYLRKTGATQNSRILVIGSVAGDCVRKSNRIYGTSKAELERGIRALNDSYHGSPRQIVLIKPGPVRTRMTEGLNRQGLQWSEPEVIARRIVSASFSSTQSTVYAPSYWGPLSRILRLLPQRVLDLIP